MKTIAIVDPGSSGHHITYMRLNVRILLKLNYRVVVFFSKPELIESWLREVKIPIDENVILSTYQIKEYTNSFFNKFSDAVSKLLKWRSLAKQIRRVEKQYKLKIDHVFFGWIDSNLANFLHPFVLDRFFTRKWSGLYFHPRHLRYNPEGLKKEARPSDIDYVLSSKNCTGIAIHDEGICNLLSERFPNSKVLLFPEIADDTTPNISYLPAKEINEKSKGRFIIGIAGMLDRMKGLKTLVESAKIMEADKYFFVFAGPLNLSHFNEEDTAMIHSFFTASPENVYTYFHFIEDGGDFNAVFNTLDVIYLVYENFASSSNRLTKAAIFKKQVIAQNEYCIGDNVDKYQLGLTIEPGNVSALSGAIEKLYADRVENKIIENQFDYFAKINSIAEMENKFKELSQTW